MRTKTDDITIKFTTILAEDCLMNNIKKLRKKKQLSQKKLAEILSVHQSAVAQWETGRTNPDMSLLILLSNVFGVSTDYLLGITDNPTPYAEIKGSNMPNSNEWELVSPQEKEVLEMIKSLSPEDNAKAEEYIKMLKTLSEVKSGEKVVDFAKKA